MNIGKEFNKIGNDVSKGTTSELNNLQKDINKIINKLEVIENKSNIIVDKIENFSKKIGDLIYNYLKDKIQAMIVIILIFLFFPHIMALVNFSTNLMLLSKINNYDQ
jgi:predicted PurR-regulated permease PerM